jgi:hypothetical protein
LLQRKIAAAQFCHVTVGGDSHVVAERSHCRGQLGHFRIFDAIKTRPPLAAAAIAVFAASFAALTTVNAGDGADEEVGQFG